MNDFIVYPCKRCRIPNPRQVQNNGYAFIRCDYCKNEIREKTLDLAREEWNKFQSEG